MAKKRITRAKPSANWYDGIIEHGIDFAAKAVGEIFERWWHGPASPPSHYESHGSDIKSEPESNDFHAPRQTRAKRKPTPWWRVLGVAENASEAEIKKAYRELMMQTHPDKLAHLSPKLQKAAEREAKKLNAALENAMMTRTHNSER